jgi:hypothetical protein
MAAGIPNFKSDWVVDGGCLCYTSYCPISGQGCCQSELQTCLCCGGDCACLPVTDNIPKTCTILPFCVVYPKMGCCMKLVDVIPDNANGAILDKKMNATIYDSVCCGPLCAGNGYCCMPVESLCADAGTTCLCCADDAACPCVDTNPVVCTLLPWCTVYPKVACCAKVGDLYPDKIIKAGGGPEGPDSEEMAR